MERLSGLELWAEKERLNLLSVTELKQILTDGGIDIVVNPWRAFETIGTINIAAQILVSRDGDFYND